MLKVWLFILIIIHINMVRIDKMEGLKKYGGVLVKCGDEFLLCKRNNQKVLPRVWSIPAGKIESGEDVVIGSIREFYEETNIQITNEEITLVGFVRRIKPNGMKSDGVLHVFLLEVDEKVYPDLENAKDGKEHTESGYFTLDKLPFEDVNDPLCKLILQNFK